MPKGTSGQVISAHPAGMVKSPSGKAQAVFDLAIEWDLRRLQSQAEGVIPGDLSTEPYIYIRTGTPLVDWFTKSEYEQYLQELEDKS